MPYSFVQVEQNKSRTIEYSMAFLCLLYVLGAVVIVGIVKYFLYAPSFDSTSYYSMPAFVSLFDLPTLFGAVGGAVLVACFHWFIATDDLINKTLQYMSGRPADPVSEAERVFCNVVEEASVATGGKFRIEPYIVQTAAMNAFALQDFQGRSVIGVTEGLLKRLNRAQLEAVVAHEAGHIVAGDCLGTTVSCVVFKAFDVLCDVTRRILLFGSYSGSSRYSSRRSSGNGQIMALALIIFLVSLVLKIIGYLGSLFVSRQREYRADAISVRLTRNPLALAEALHIINQRWKGAGVPGETMDAIFILNPRHNAVDEQDDLLSDLFSTHPPINKRIAILLEMAHARKEDLDVALAKSMERSVTGEVVQNNAQVQIPVPIPIPLAATMQTVPLTTDQCPRCRGVLGTSVYEGVSVLECHGCKGLLVSEADVMKIVYLREKKFDADILELARITRDQVKVLKGNPFDRIYDEKSIVCPVCLDAGRRMTRRFVSQKYPIEVDRCKICTRVWFDKGEIEILQCLFEMDNPSTSSA